MSAHNGAAPKGRSPSAEEIAGPQPDVIPHTDVTPAPGGDAPVRQCRFHLRSGDTVIDISWDLGEPGEEPRVRAEAAEPPPGTFAAFPGGSAPDTASDQLQYVRAPMVGTFYQAPDAGARPFVGVGDVVQPGQTVGILEVMKLMNPITAEVGGRVVEMLVDDAQPVEYDQPLIALEPLGHG